MSKPYWKLVYVEHYNYMCSLVNVVMRKYHAKSPENAEVRNLMLNLIEEDALMEISRLAFKKAYLNWDEKRPFKPFYRHVFFNMAKDEIRRAKLRRYRETNLGAFEDDNGKNLQGVDCKTGWIPIEVVDFLDFLNTLPPIQKNVVYAILHSDEVLGLKVGGVKELLGRLKKHTMNVMGLSARAYYEMMTDIGMRVHFRARSEKRWKVREYVRA